MTWIATKTFYETTDFREVLRCWIETQKSLKHFSFRKISKQAGFTSPNYFQLVMSGKRNLGFEGFTKLTKLMGITGLERDYFRELVEFSNAKTHDGKKQRFEKLLKIRNRAQMLHSFRLPILNYEYLSTWAYVAVREFVAANPNISSSERIAKLLEFQIKTSEVERAIDFLIANHLIEKTSTGFRTLKMNLVSTDEINSLSVRSFHQQVLNLAGQAVREMPLEEREFGALTLSLTEREFSDLKRRMKAFRTEIHSAFATPKLGARVVQISLLAFPLSKASSNGNSNSKLT